MISHLAYANGSKSPQSSLDSAFEPPFAGQAGCGGLDGVNTLLMAGAIMGAISGGLENVGGFEGAMVWVVKDGCIGGSAEKDGCSGCIGAAWDNEIL